MRKDEKKTIKRDIIKNSAAEIAEFITAKFKASPNKKYTIKSLASAIGAPDKEGRYAVKDVIESLVKQEVIVYCRAGEYKLNAAALESFIGKADMIASGSMYVCVEGQERDIFVNQRSAGQALHGDIVEVIVTHTAKNGTPEGELVRIVERNPKKYVGVVELSPNFAFVKLDSRKIPYDIFIPLSDDHKFQSGEKVLVRIKNWPKGSKNPIGEIVDTFGLAGDNNAEMHAILAEYDLPYEFDKEVEEAAEKISEIIPKEEYKNRRDFRDVTTFTIDPADAKDFDDALSIKKLEDGNWEIGVHIADVTYYVTPGSIVDTEAIQRATSVYLVDRTIPMLPEKLSNKLCSLRPNEEKLTYSAVFKIDSDAKVVDEWFGRTVICSDKRFAYADAQELIDGAEGELKDEVLTLNTLAQKMRAERFKKGAIGFDRGEAKFDLDENGKPLGVHFKVQKEANQLIEEFMLLANKKVAEFIGKKRGKGANAERTFVYRVHDQPNMDKLASFKSFIMKFGYNFKAEEGISVAKELNKLMSKIKGTSEENVISTLAIRTMAKAYYATENIGHYGLAFKHYTHFTSPIRRYPDMIVHRLMEHYLQGGQSPELSIYNELCEHSSEMEVRAAEAERASIKYKMVEYMLDNLGEEFVGHISGVTEWGVYVELDDTHIEGMVSLREMQDDFYTFDSENYCIVGNSSRRTFTLGDAVKIKVLRADLARKQLDFSITATINFETGEETALEFVAQNRDDNSSSNNSHQRKSRDGAKQHKRNRIRQ